MEAYIVEKYWCIKSVKSISALKVLKKNTEYKALSNSYKRS